VQHTTRRVALLHEFCVPKDFDSDRLKKAVDQALDSGRRLIGMVIGVVGPALRKMKFREL